MNKLLALAEGAAMVVSQQRLTEIGYRRPDTQIDPKRDNHNLHTLSYFGLPYQDHNYGAPPPPTPPQSPPRKAPNPVLSVVEPPPPEEETPLEQEGVNTVSPEELPSECKKEAESSEEEREEEEEEEEADESNQDEGITRCICDFEHDDGYMICCDKCLVWQHVECMGLDRSNIPDNYFCEMCEPRLVDVATAKILQGKKKKHLEELQKSENLRDEGKATATSSKGRKKMKKKKKKKEKDRDKEDENRRRDKKKRRKDRERGDSTTSNGSDDTPRSEGNESDTAHQDDPSSSKEASLIQCTPELEELMEEYRKNPEMFLAGAATYHGSPEEMKRTKVCIGQVSKGEVNGVVTLEQIPANEPIMQLSGTLSLLDEQRKNSQLDSFMFVYSSFCNTELVLNAGSHDNKARFTRKSCSPNAEIRHMIVDGEVQLYTFALKDISSNTEVTLGFDFDFTLGQHPVKCSCGRKTCPVKKFWHKHKSNGIKQKNNNTVEVKLNSPVQKTVSPLKLTLNKQTSQGTLLEDTDEPEPVELSKSEPVTPGGKVSEETTETKPLHKMTREERKMDAIVKAFERLEKMQQRRQQAKEKQQSVAKTGDSPEQPKQEDKEREPEETNTEQKPTERKEEEKVKEEEKDKTEEKDEVNVTEQEQEQEEVLVPQVEVKPKPRVQRKRRRTTGSRRRSRNSSGASSTVSIEVSSAEDDAISVSLSSSCPSTAGAAETTLHTSTTAATVPALAVVSPAQPSAAAVISLAQPSAAVSSSSTSGTLLSVQTNSLSENKIDNTPLASPAANSKHFKFPKTKRFFMNEWLNEQAQEASADSPLTVKTENFDVPTLNSPNAAAPRERTASLDVSFGSAKKRWLRQAMQETSQPGSNGSNSPVCNGGEASPVTPSPAVSPVSNSSDFMTPLKKRLLRHSLSEERLSHLRPELQSEDTTSVDPSLLTIKEEKEKSEESPSKNISFHLGLPAKKEMRKNSSLDSGLSVTTPADFEMLPSFPAVDGGAGEAADKKLASKEEEQKVKEPEKLKEDSPSVGQEKPKDVSQKTDPVAMVDPASTPGPSSTSGIITTSGLEPALVSGPTSGPVTTLGPVTALSSVTTLSSVPYATTTGSPDAPPPPTDVVTTPTAVMSAPLIGKSLKRCLSDEVSFTNGEINPAYFSPKKRHLYLRQNTDPGATPLGASWPRPELSRVAPVEKDGSSLSQSWSGSSGAIPGPSSGVASKDLPTAGPGYPPGSATVAGPPASAGFASPARVGQEAGPLGSVPPGSERVLHLGPPEAMAYPHYPGQQLPVLAEDYLTSPEPAAASVSAPTTPSKKRVSLLEYRKRKSVSTTKTPPEKPEAAAEESKGASLEAKVESSPTSTTADSAPEKPNKPASVITFKDKKFPLVVDSSVTSGSEGGLQSLPLFSKKPIAELDGGKKLTLTDEAHKLITSLTEVLMEGKSATKPPNRIPDVNTTQEDPLQRMRRELNEKNTEKVMALKRAHSPEPPPPPPEKKMKPEDDDRSSPVPPPPPPRNAPSYGQALHSPKGGGLKIANHVVVNSAGFTPVQQIVPQTNGGHVVYPTVMAGNSTAPQYQQQPIAVQHSPRGSQQQLHHQPIAAQVSPRGSQQPITAKHSPRGLYSPAPASTSPRGTRPHPNSFQYNNHVEEPLVPVPNQGPYPNYNNGGDPHYHANSGGGGRKISPTSYTNNKYPSSVLHDKMASSYGRNSLSPRGYQRH